MGGGLRTCEANNPVFPEHIRPKFREIIQNLYILRLYWPMTDVPSDGVHGAFFKVPEGTYMRFQREIIFDYLRKSFLVLMGTALVVILDISTRNLLAAPERSGEITYTNHEVQPGETLFKLAEKYYGDGYQWPRIKECNRWIDPQQLRVGQIVCIPNPTRSTKSSNLFSWWGNPGKQAAEAPAIKARKSQNKPKENVRKISDPGVTQNPGPSSNESAPVSWREMFQELNSVIWFGRPLSQVLLLIMGWFIIHMMIQGAFTWFAAHMAFVKDVSFKKAWRATLQSETLAVLFLGIVGVAGLAVIYVATAPPGKPVISELMGIAEQYLSQPTGLAMGGLSVIFLYVFLGIRFIPQAFDTSGGQGFTVVFLSVLVPHVIFIYLVGYRLGYIG